MRKKLMLSAALGAVLFGGVTITTTTRDNVEKGAPFLNPLLTAGAICGGDDAFAGRRAFFLRAASAYAQTMENNDQEIEALRPSLGAVSYAITTDDAEAQAWFNQGLAYAYGFNHAEAVKSFRRAQSLDPDCAMCFWGEALALGPNINAGMADEDVPSAYEALEKALARRDNASEKERALINALSYRYEKAPLKDRSKLDNAFADAMDEVARQYPDDDFIATLAAENNMVTQPWDYWMDDGRTPKGRTARTVSLLETVLERNHQQPAAIHLYIHLTEASRDPFRAVEHADRLAALTPGLGHLVHMPSHTYYRVGQFKKSLDHNLEAVDADAVYLETAKNPSPIYEFGYYPHNIHFAMASAQIAGDAKNALAMAKKLDEKLPFEMVEETPWIQPIKASYYYAMAQFADPAEILALEDPGENLPFMRGAWHYARGEAFAKLNQRESAMGEVEAISKLIAEADMGPVARNATPVIEILNIARLTIIARQSALDGDLDSAIEAMEEATFIQEQLRYTEPPYWYYPAKQTLAAMLLQAGKTERAEQLFIETLTVTPNNAYALYGLAQTYKAQGDKDAAKFAERLYKKAWFGGKRQKPELNQL